MRPSIRVWFTVTWSIWKKFCVYGSWQSIVVRMSVQWWSGDDQLRDCSRMAKGWSRVTVQRWSNDDQRVAVQRWSMRGQRVTVQRWSNDEIKRGDCSKMIRGWSKGHCSLTLHTLAFGIIRWLNRTSKDSSWADSIDFFRRELHFRGKFDPKDSKVM